VSSGVKIEFSENAVTAIAVGACFLGFCYLIYKLTEPVEGEGQVLPKEAKDFSMLPSVSPETFEQIGYHSEVKSRAGPSFRAGDYSGSVRAAILAFYDVIRKKSGIAADATNLIQRVFRGKAPVLKFQLSAPAYIENADVGLIDMMEGFSKSVRKIHMHAEISLTKTQALQEICIACYLADQVERYSYVVPDGHDKA